MRTLFDIRMSDEVKGKIRSMKGEMEEVIRDIDDLRCNFIACRYLAEHYLKVEEDFTTAQYFLTEANVIYDNTHFKVRSIEARNALDFITD